MSDKATAMRRFRLKAKRTKIEVAIAVGVTELAYSRWESGQAEPNGGNLIKLLFYFRRELNRPSLDISELMEVSQ